MIKSKLKDLELLWDPDHKEYYLKAKYETEDEHRVTEHIIPHIVLPVTDSFEAVADTLSAWVKGNFTCNIGFGELQLREAYVYIPSDSNPVSKACYVSRVIEEKTKEMTIEEIEKKLGYKIKIVGDKNE